MSDYLCNPEDMKSPGDFSQKMMIWQEIYTVNGLKNYASILLEWLYVQIQDLFNSRHVFPSRNGPQLIPVQTSCEYQKTSRIIYPITCLFPSTGYQALRPERPFFVMFISHSFTVGLVRNLGNSGFGSLPWVRNVSQLIYVNQEPDDPRRDE
jgi:hypothetical protein